MLKKILLLFAVCTSSLFAGDYFIEAKGAYFCPEDGSFDAIYGGGGQYGAELNAQLCGRFYGWMSADYFSKNGASIGEKTPTCITFVPLGIGIKYIWPVGCFDLYAGAGVLGTYLHIKNESSFVASSISDWGGGVIGKAGTLVPLTRCFSLDFFANYVHSEIETKHRPADLSGWSFGGALVYRFGTN